MAKKSSHTSSARSGRKKKTSSPRVRRKVHAVMKEYKEGTLHSRSASGPKVTSRKQAIAIAMSEAGVSKKRSSKKKSSKQ